MSIEEKIDESERKDLEERKNKGIEVKEAEENLARIDREEQEADLKMQRARREYSEQVRGDSLTDDMIRELLLEEQEMSRTRFIKLLDSNYGIDMSRQTITSRLRKAERVGLIEERMKTIGRQSMFVYALTGEGLKQAMLMEGTPYIVPSAQVPVKIKKILFPSSSKRERVSPVENTGVDKIKAWGKLLIVSDVFAMFLYIALVRYAPQYMEVPVSDAIIPMIGIVLIALACQSTSFIQANIRKVSEIILDGWVAIPGLFVLLIWFWTGGEIISHWNLVFYVALLVVTKIVVNNRLESS